MLSNNNIHKAIVWACQQEVSAPKPGNVNCFSDGHNMSVQDFIKSAHAIAPVLSQDQTVGTYRYSTSCRLQHQLRHHFIICSAL
jgi:triphosphoribosyl-dephospho-CoA synthetase